MKRLSLKDSVVLITGGTGSFGQKVATHILSSQPKEIRVFSRDEKKQWEMRNAYPHFTYLLGDVRDPQRLNEAMEGVDYVFHAAALKQVPSCEQMPLEAIKTNVLGSQNACDAAKRNGVKVFVALSTDKAVKPINSMGTTKALMEKIVTSQNQTKSSTVFCCVRYGNVMGSRGSVIPLFLKQIREGRPMTVTVPHMTRFMMTLEDSVELVVHAFSHAKGGEIFVRKAPACTVKLLAEAMASKFSPKGKSHPIEITGPRPGEKIAEILVNEYEMMRIVEDKEHYRILPEYSPVVDRSAGRPFGREYTSENTRQLTTQSEVIELLERMAPTEIDYALTA